MRSQFNLETAVTVRAVRASEPITSQLPIFSAHVFCFSCRRRRREAINSTALRKPENTFFPAQCGLLFFFLSVSSKSRPAYTMNDWFDVRFAI